MHFDRDKFFSAYRSAFGKLNQSQVDGLNFLLDEIETDPEWASVPQLAYFLATIQHETGIERNGVLQTFQPIKELRATSGKVKAQQDKYWGSGFFGRGYVQLTHKANYQKAGKAFGVDLVGDPDLALNRELSYKIAAIGMREGWFTGHKLSDHINGRVDYRNARKVVNGLDKADLIASRADKFESVLRDSLVTESKPDTEPAVTTQSTEPPVVEIKRQAASLYTKVMAGAGPVGAALSGVGAKLGGVEFSNSTVIGFFILLGITIIAGAFIYDRGQQRALERAKLNVRTLADKDQHNVVTP